jgi:GMP synthase-like glutamine amidotransferase
MKPIAVFRHSPGEGPGYFATFLERHGIPWELVAIDAGVPPPPTPTAYSGLCFMGGPMSVNDDLPWIPPILDLIREARRLDLPVIGHCLGGQLMSRAFGGTVGRNAVKEIGWGEVRRVASPLAADWLADTDTFLAFHWHGETFSIPDGATRLLESPWCANQAFVLGPHLAMQCHVEMTPSMIESWCRTGAGEIAEFCVQPSVQQAADMQEEMETRIAGLRRAADRLYAYWLRGLPRD